VLNPGGFDEATESAVGRPGIAGRPLARADFPPWDDGILLASPYNARQIGVFEDRPGLWLVDPTSVSLLDRLKTARPDASDWHRLQGIYLPLIQRWLRRVPGLGDEAEDLAQEVFLVLARELPRFERRREGSFRAWLRTITVNKARNFGKQRNRRPTVRLDLTDGFLDQMADPESDLAREWDREHDEHVVQKILAAVQPDFHPSTWEAFQRFALEGLPAARVAVELGLSENAVLLAKSRVVRRLREEAGDLLR
jgi:RNA polymerase sigma-70 factor (ECF subfamily)